MTGSSVRLRPSRSAKPGGWAVAASDRLARGGRDGGRGHRLGAALVSPDGQRVMTKAAAAGVAAAVALGVHIRWVRPRAVSWGATAWARPTIVTELILMEIGDPFMMRKCLLGIKQRAGQRAAGRRFQR
jgi:hypothetical protein